MSSVLFYCDTDGSNQQQPNGEWSQIIQLCINGNNPNLRLDREGVNNKILKLLDPIARDLIDIACYVYGGDQLVSRGGKADVYGRKWERELHFVIPVSDPDYWCRSEVVHQLTETLEFLTGDKFSFSFIKDQPVKQQQLSLSSQGLDLNFTGVDCVILFSGGADSLSAVVEQVAVSGKHPLLVSHRSAPVYDTRQKNLVELLRNRFPAWNFPHVNVWANLLRVEAKEYTQRSRSFLYASLAAAVAYQTNTKEIILSDNGIVSINLPKNGQLLGTFASRTTHPKFLWNFEHLIQLVLDPELTIRNTLLFRTKADVLEILKKNGCSSLLQETVSCARTRQPQVTPHCGVCSQCIDRRFGSEAAEMELHDIKERYGIDIFTEAISEGEDRAQVEAFVRFAQHLENLSDDQLFTEYPQLIDCILADDPNANDTAKLYVDLLRRHATQVRGVLKRKTALFFDRLYEASLPDTSLIRLVTSGELLTNQVVNLAIKVENILTDGLPTVFQSRDPQNEHEVQDASEALLNAAGEKLLRELPLLPFAGISTKPDFSKLDKSIYYVEMKYLKARDRLNGIITEITSRVQIYTQQGAYVHFVVYDPKHIILDLASMKNSIEVDGIVRLGVIR